MSMNRANFLQKIFRKSDDSVGTVMCCVTQTYRGFSRKHHYILATCVLDIIEHKKRGHLNAFQMPSTHLTNHNKSL